MQLLETTGSIRQGSRLVGDKVAVQLRASGPVWNGIFPHLSRSAFDGTDPRFFFTLRLEDDREAEIAVTFRDSRLIPFEIAFEGVEKKRKSA